MSFVGADCLSQSLPAAARQPEFIGETAEPPGEEVPILGEATEPPEAEASILDEATQPPEVEAPILDEAAELQDPKYVVFVSTTSPSAKTTVIRRRTARRTLPEAIGVTRRGADS